MKTKKSPPHVIEVQIAHLIEDPDNPNHMTEGELDALAENIRTVGFLQPILVKKSDTRHEGEPTTYEIVDGHHRTRAAQKAGMARVLAVVWDGTEEMRQALAIGMNKLRGALNLGEVAKILADLSTNAGWTNEELKITGYSDQEIDDLLKAAQPATDEDVLDGATTNQPDEPAEEDSSRTFTLELSFSSADDLAKAKRALKRAAGKGRDLADGLLDLLAARDNA